MKIPNVAYKAAARSGHPQHFHGAVAVRGGAIVGIGYNRNGIHAEEACIRSTWPNQRKGLRVISIRVGKNGDLALAKPCQDCQKYMKKHGIKSVYYSDSSGHLVLMKL